MERRQFLKNSALLGGALAIAPAVSCNQVPNSRPDAEVELKEKVKLAMFSMQRASWEQGVAAQAFVEAGDHTMTVLMAKEAQLRQTPEGRLSVLYHDNGVTDPAASGEAVLEAYKISGDPGLKDAADNMLNYLLNEAPKSAEGILHHTLNAPEIWSDSLYMAPPFLAAAGQYDEAVKQIKGMRKVLWNTEKQLYSHRWDAKRKVFITEQFWGGGNGWAAAGIARVAKALPMEFNTQKTELIGYYKEVVDGCLAHLRADGFFHNFINEPETFVETNLSQMIAYSIFVGMSQGWLPGSYAEKALLMRSAATSKIDINGYIQDACGAPFFDKPGRSTEAQAFYLLMETAHQNWTKRN
jgi:rhamnogalacturonyl hydrolase YesR